MPLAYDPSSFPPVTTDQPVVVVDGSSGTVQTSDFHITKKIDKASPKLMLACAD